ncbi:MAG: hypothetical protein L3J71_07880 [Victivallaceae bacterium]|nr:hypothetical protein [Victivallaceae bacterium]
METNILKIVKWFCRRLTYNELGSAIIIFHEVLSNSRSDIDLKPEAKPNTSVRIAAMQCFYGKRITCELSLNAPTPRAGFKTFDGAVCLTVLFVAFCNFMRSHSSLNGDVPVPPECLNGIELYPQMWSALLKKAI